MIKFKILFLTMVLMGSSLILNGAKAAEVLVKPGDDYQAVLNRGDSLQFQAATIYPIHKTLVLKHKGQTLSTYNAKDISDYAILRLVDDTFTQIIDSNAQANIIIEKLILDGNRYRLSVSMSSMNPLIFLGGNKAKNQTIRDCVIINARSWSTLKMHEGGLEIRAERNIIIGAGTDARGNGRENRERPFAWGDGISCAAAGSTIINNIIIDPTDVGIVLFGAPGSLVKHNVIASISRESLGAINMVDPLNFYALNKDGSQTDYRKLVITENYIHADGARIHIAVPMGATPWAPHQAGNILVGAEVSKNIIDGRAGGYGFIADGIDQFNIYGNISRAKYSGLGDGLGNALPEAPGAFYYTSGKVGNSQLQKEFLPAQRHLQHLLRCNHGPVDAMGYRVYPYGEYEVEAAVEAAYFEMLGRAPQTQELAKHVRWMAQTQAKADDLRVLLMNLEEFKKVNLGVVASDIHLYRTALWLQGFFEVIKKQGSMDDTKKVYDLTWERLKSSDFRSQQAKTIESFINACKNVPITAKNASLKGKVICGYQGWYRTPTDGSGLGFEHYETYGEEFEPGKCGSDFWPAMGELDAEEKFATPFKHSDGQTATVFSSQHPKTVERHFRWMKEAGIDGVFLQRFAVDVVGFHHQSNLLLPSNNKIFQNVQRGAQINGRTYAIMYDLTGMPKGEMKRIMDDWRQLNKTYHVLKDISYQGHSNKPLVAIWGVGFDDGRKYDFDDVAELMSFFKNDPEYGGCSIALGVPAYWRSMERDSSKDPAFHALIKQADVVIPWSIGRFGGVAAATLHGKEVFEPDIQWCQKAGLDYLPTVFPGFSWANRYQAKNAPFDHIPREGGQFLWSQCVAAKKAGAKMIYVAMFDEMDEGTQIFKVTSDVPVGKSRFLSYEPLPEDFYLRLTGKVGEMLRGEIPCTDDLPIRK